jgi:hypothetical protein
VPPDYLAQERSCSSSRRVPAQEPEVEVEVEVEVETEAETEAVFIYLRRSNTS